MTTADTHAASLARFFLRSRALSDSSRTRRQVAKISLFRQTREDDEALLRRMERADESGGEADSYQKLRQICLLYTSPSPRDKRQSRMPSSA